MSDDEEVTEEVLARLSHDLAEHVRASLREGDEGGAVVDSGGVETNEDAPAPTTSAVSWSSREAPDDDDIMISALVSAMAKGREMMASPGGGTDPVRVTVNLDKDEPATTTSRSSSRVRERKGFGSSAPRVTAPKLPADADVPGPGLALVAASRPSAPARTSRTRPRGRAGSAT